MMMMMMMMMRMTMTMTMTMRMMMMMMMMRMMMMMMMMMLTKVTPKGTFCQTNLETFFFYGSKQRGVVTKQLVQPLVEGDEMGRKKSDTNGRILNTTGRFRSRLKL